MCYDNNKSITSWDEVCKCFYKLEEEKKNWVFRGQRDKLPLESTLYRKDEDVSFKDYIIKANPRIEERNKKTGNHYKPLKIYEYPDGYPPSFILLGVRNEAPLNANEAPLNNAEALIYVRHYDTTHHYWIGQQTLILRCGLHAIRVAMKKKSTILRYIVIVRQIMTLAVTIKHSEVLLPIHTLLTLIQWERLMLKDIKHRNQPTQLLQSYQTIKFCLLLHINT